MAVLCKQSGHEQGQLERDVKDDTIGDHAEPSARWDFGETSCTGGSASFPASPQCPRVCPDGHYAATVRLTPAEKTSLDAQDLTVTYEMLWDGTPQEKRFSARG